jgi:hypothetical protein
MVKTTKVAFVMVFKISRGIRIMARYDKTENLKLF